MHIICLLIENPSKGDRMKLRAYISTIAMIAALTGCDHGFEGTYKGKVDSSDQFVDAIAEAASASRTLTIGSNYVESEGEHREFDDIFVRDADSESYLVFKDKNEEIAWKIVDKNTLLVSVGFMSVKFVRID